jgi:arylsulfatase A-like enzyme
LFIAIDDLNHWVGHLNRNEQAKTPHIDRLAARGVSFAHAYCAAPACNPSRAALLSGMRPSTTGVYHNPDDWTNSIGEGITLPAWFKSHGYHVAGAGKIYHGSLGRKSDWSEFHDAPGGDPKPGEAARMAGKLPIAALDAADEDLSDWKNVDWTIEQLGKDRDEPFFLACGLRKPHLPWNVPQEYFDLHPLDQVELPPTIPDDLADIPPAGRKMAKPEGDHAAILKSDMWHEAVQAYLAACSYTDVNVGRLLDALYASGHADDTIVCLWGDHGWHLGEKEHWRKFSLWEEATRAPLIVVAPGVTPEIMPGQTPEDRLCERPVDFLAIYPTLCELCDLPLPGHLEGESLAPLLADPNAERPTPALMTHGKGNHAVRSERFRYIRYADGSEELYDETADPLEHTNVAADPAFADVKRELARLLPATERKPVPPFKNGGREKD